MTSVPDSFQVVEIARHGGPEQLRLATRSRGPLAPGCVRIRVAAVGVNFADVMARLGLYAPAPPPPFVPGFEVAGTVVEVDRRVTRFAPGDRVIAGSRFGGYASELDAAGSRVLPLPPDWSFAEGAGFLASYGTAWHALVTVGRLAPGASLLVHAGAGGLGIAATQIARHLGARVVACAGGPEKAHFCEQQGAAAGIDYLRPGWPAEALRANGGRRFQVVLDSVLGRDFGSWRELVAPMGQLVLVGAASFTPAQRVNWLRLGWKWLWRPRLDLIDFISQNRSVSGFNILLLWEDEDYLDELGQRLQALAAVPGVRPVIDRSFPAAEAGRAHDHLQQRRSRGKVVLSFE